MLEGIYNNYRKYADEINWKQYSCNDLFREYIKHENDSLRDNFFAAIVCRYWGYSGRIYLQCNHHVDFESCYDCVIDAIKYVLDKRVWENPNNSLYNDPNGPDKAIHIALKRQKSIMLSKLTAYRRMSNFNTLSLDGAHESFNDSADGLLFNIESSESDLSIKSLISNYFINKDDIINGIILDIICYGNYSDFSLKNIIKDIKLINKKYYKYYYGSYNVNYKDFMLTLKEIKNMSNRMLEVKIKSLLHSLKREVLDND